jgi:hypothetical protein
MSKIVCELCGVEFHKEGIFVRCKKFRSALYGGHKWMRVRD